MNSFVWGAHFPNPNLPATLFPRHLNVPHFLLFVVFIDPEQVQIFQNVADDRVAAVPGKLVDYGLAINCCCPGEP
jgi:hypothetical protein